jgi:hypothetical protein
MELDFAGKITDEFIVKRSPPSVVASELLCVKIASGEIKPSSGKLGVAVTTLLPVTENDGEGLGVIGI